MTNYDTWKSTDPADAELGRADMNTTRVTLNRKNYVVTWAEFGAVLCVDCQIMQTACREDYRYRTTWHSASGKPLTSTAEKVIREATRALMIAAHGET